MGKQRELENRAVWFAHHVMGNITKMRRLRADEHKYEIHAAYKTMVNAIENGTRLNIYCAAVHLAAVAGKYAIKHGDQSGAVAQAFEKTAD